MTAQVAIVCDRCGDIGAVGTSAPELREDLNGWTWRNGLDTCPLCRLVTSGGLLGERYDSGAPQEP